MSLFKLLKLLRSVDDTTYTSMATLESAFTNPTPYLPTSPLTMSAAALESAPTGPLTISAATLESAITEPFPFPFMPTNPLTVSFTNPTPSPTNPLTA